MYRLIDPTGSVLPADRLRRRALRGPNPTEAKA
jgi:hypothetical protein